MAKKPKVLLIGWDGADWDHITPLLDAGKLPTLERLINGGVMGNLATLQPVLSPMLWNSVATGKFAQKHGIFGFTEPDPVSGGARPFSSMSRNTKALWNIFSQSGIRSNVINWWASHPAEPIDGCIVSNLFNGVTFDPQQGWQITPGTIHPPELEQAFAKFKVFASELNESHILPFIPDAAKIAPEDSGRLKAFCKVLTETATTHSIATAVMETQDWDFTAVYYTGIDHFSHAFMQFHPPQMENVSDADFQMYRGVIEGAYFFHDMMLQRLIDLAGEDTTVVLCSDHGFQSGSGRPLGSPREPAGPAIWHRPYGIVVMNGQNIKQDERIYGASLIDIGPTILSLFDLPIGEDMDGRPLLQAFENPPAIKTIPSWDDVESDRAGMLPADAQMADAQGSKELLQQFIALGYIDEQGSDLEKQHRTADIESKYNLAQTLAWQGKHDDALPLLYEIVERSPWETRFILQLADCCLHAGYIKQADAVISTAFDLADQPPTQAISLHARIAIARGQMKEATRWFQAAIDRSPNNPALHVELGQVFGRQRMWKRAVAAYQNALSLNGDLPLAHQGLARAYRMLKQYDESIASALNAVGLLHRLPKAHLNLGISLLRKGDYERAKLALETTLSFNPKNQRANRYLVELYKNYIDDPDKLAFYESQLRERPAGGAEDGKRMARRDVLRPLPNFGTEQERRQRLLIERPRPGDEVEPSGKEFVVVSGLPRSGTSLMMQMLEAGGMPLITDQIRAADENNPLGYCEWEDIKSIASQPEILDGKDVDGRAFKAVSILVGKLPKSHAYKIIFMMRPVEQVAQSQRKMVDRLGTTGGELSLEELERGLAAHREATLEMLDRSQNVEVLPIDYLGLLDDPSVAVEQLCSFLGADRLPAASQMAVAVKPNLCRERNESNGP